MNRPIWAFQNAPKCTATSKRTRVRCGAPAERGKAVCRFHGARGGGPKGKSNGAFKTGVNSNEVLGMRRDAAILVRQSRQVLSEME